MSLVLDIFFSATYVLFKCLVQLTPQNSKLLLLFPCCILFWLSRAIIRIAWKMYKLNTIFIKYSWFVNFLLFYVQYLVFRFWYLTNSSATSSKKLIWFVTILYWTDLLQVLHMNKDRKVERPSKWIQTFYFSFHSLWRWCSDIEQFLILWFRHLIC